LDRFLLQLHLGYPTDQQELEMINRMLGEHPIERVQPVLSVEDVLALQRQVSEVTLSDAVKTYIVRLSQRSREHPDVYLGISPRGTLALCRAVQALAFVRGRDYVIPDDVKELVPYTFRHRMILKPEARLEGATVERVLSDLLRETRVPIS